MDQNMSPRSKRFRVGELQEMGIPLREGTLGKTTLKRFIVPDTLQFGMRAVPPGEYWSLHTDGILQMSDTPDEVRDHMYFVCDARGHVFVIGLGLGMVTSMLLRKDTVTKVTVLEKNPEIISLVGTQLLAFWGNRLEIIEGDAFTWKAPKDATWDYCWLDIWPYICTSNLPEITKLKRRFARKVKHPIQAWVEHLLRREKRRDSRAY